MDEQQRRHDRFREDVAAHALGVLDPADSERVERHLSACPSCRALAAEYRAVVGLIPAGLAPVRPPLGARERLLARARSRGGHGVPATPRWWARPAGRPALAVAAVLVVALGLVIGRGVFDSTPAADDPAGIVARLRERGDVRVLALAGSPAAPAGRAELLLPASGATAGLAVEDLPPLPPGWSYQVWFVRPDQTRVSGGVFAVDDGGDAVASVAVPPAIEGFSRVGVTAEPAGGSPAPTGANVLAGSF